MKCFPVIFVIIGLSVLFFTQNKVFAISNELTKENIKDAQLFFHPDTPAKEIAKKILKELQKGSYESVNDYFTYLVFQKTTSKNGTRLLEDVYISLIDLHEKETWKAWINSPKTGHAAYITQGLWAINQAGKARGTGLACTVTAERRKAMDGFLSEAQKYLEHAYSLQPHDPNSSAGMISICNLKSYPIGIMEEWFQKAMSADPSALTAYLNKLHYLAPMWHGSHEKMKQFAESSYEQSPEGSIVYSTLLYFYKYMLQIYPPWGLGHYLSDINKQKKENCYQRISNKFPESIRMKLLQARIAKYSPNHDLALQLYDAILQSDPDNHEALFEIAEVYLNKPFGEDKPENRDALLPSAMKIKKAKAEKFLKKALSLKADGQTAYTLAELAIDRNNSTEALRYLDLAIKLDPMNNNYYGQRARLYKKSNQLDSAIEDFSEAIRFNPCDIHSLFDRSECYEKQNRFDLAKKDLLTAKLVDPKHSGGANSKLERILSKESNFKQNQAQPSVQYAIITDKNNTPTPSPPEDINTLFKKAETAYFLRQADTAKVILFTILEAEPKYHKANYLLGQIAARLENNYRNAIRHYNIALKSDPDNKKYLSARAKAFYTLRDYQASINDYTKVIIMDQTNGDAYYYRGLSFDALGEKESAIKDMQMATMYSFDMASAAQEYLAQYAKPQFPQAAVDPVFELYELARSNMMMGRYDAAEKNYKDILKLDKTSTEAYMQLAEIAVRRDENPPKAISFYDRLIKINPAYKDAYRMRGLEYMFLGEFKKCVDDYTDFVKLDPKNSDALAGRAKCYLKLEKYEKAYKDYQVAKKYNPADSSYDNALAELQVKLDLPVEEDSKDISLLLSRSDAYLREKEFELAIKELKTVLQLEPNDDIAYIKLAKIESEVYRNLPNAIQYYNKAIELKPAESEYYLERGLVLYKQENWQAAKTDFTFVLKEQPNSGRIYYYRGSCNQYLGEKEQAKQDFLKVIELDPSWAGSAKRNLQELME